MENNEVITISNAETLTALNKAEVDIQIETAKRYPMHSTPDQIQTALAKAEMFALIDESTAQSCFYRLEREGKDGSKSIIEGPSIRLAEIIASCWGNLRVQTIIAGNDGKTITARGACHDLESNVAIAVDVKRSIVTKKGYTFSQDMQVVTGNAAASIARRNAILSVIPEAVFKRSYERIKSAAIGAAAKQLPVRVANMFKTFAVAGIKEEDLLQYLNIKSRDAVTAEMVVNLGSLWNAIRDGQTTVEETFRKPAEQKATAERVKETQRKTSEKIAAAAAGARAQAQPVTVPADLPDDLPEDGMAIDPATGEVVS